MDMGNGLWYTNIQLFAVYVDFECAKNILFIHFLFWVLEDVRGSWLGILIFVWIWSIVFYTNVCWLFALYIDFRGARNIYVILSPNLGGLIILEVCDWGLELDLDLDIFTFLGNTNDPNFGSLQWFGRC